MEQETVGLLCADPKAQAAWMAELARAGLAVQPVERGGAASGVQVLIVRARTAAEALDLLRERPTRGESPAPVLVLLDEGDSEDRASLLEHGADDCLAQPVSARELGARLGRLAGTADLARQTARHAALLRREMTHARRVQEHILPLKPPAIDRLEIVVEYVPATDIGGDFFDIIPFDDGRVAFFMADVVGHGIGAALNTMLIKSQLVIWAREGITVGETLGMLNNYLYTLTDLDYATAVYAVLDVRAREMEYVVAGHPNPLLVRPDWGVRMLEAPRMPASAPGGVHVGLPLGLFEDGVYVPARVQLRPADRVLFYTDGLIEWRDAEGEMLGIEGLRALLEQTRDRPLADQVAWLLAQVDLGPGDVSPADDVNIVAFAVA